MTFRINFTLYDSGNQILKTGTFRVKNKPNMFIAKCAFDDFLRRKYSDYNRLVIHKCKEEFINPFESIFPG